MGSNDDVRLAPIVVRLTKQERTKLEGMLSHGSGMVRVFKRARLLLLMDQGSSAAEAARSVGVNDSTARRIGNRYNSEGLEEALYEKPRPGAERALSKKQETTIVAMVCTKPPEGCARWTISLITKEAIRRKIVKTVGDTTIRLLLKRHDLKPWREKNVVRD